MPALTLSARIDLPVVPVFGPAMPALTLSARIDPPVLASSQVSLLLSREYLLLGYV